VTAVSIRLLVSAAEARARSLSAPSPDHCCLLLPAAACCLLLPTAG
jgi:hypothetical protein